MALAQRQEEILLSGDELAALPDLPPCELIDGRIVPMSPTGLVHGEIELNLGLALAAKVRSAACGRVVVGEVGIYIRRDPDTVRAADLLYISHERHAQLSGEAFLDVAPELVVEILSPEDRWSAVTAKLEDYFSIGVERVWVVDPKLRKVFVYRSPTEAEAFGESETLTDEAPLPGFSLELAGLFPG